MKTSAGNGTAQPIAAHTHATTANLAVMKRVHTSQSSPKRIRASIKNFQRLADLSHAVTRQLIPIGASSDTLAAVINAKADSHTPSIARPDPTPPCACQLPYCLS
jgi:hypothetical protein